MNTKTASPGLALRLLLLVCVALPQWALAVETTSGIRGTVYGVDGKALEGATVEILDERTGARRTFNANNEGGFYAARLPVGGPYKITVNGSRTVTVPNISLGDIYNLDIKLGSDVIEEVVVYGSAGSISDVAAGPSATFSNYDLQTAPAVDRDIQQVYAIDPRINLDLEGRGASAVNCAGKHPRFNSTTVDGVNYSDRFGLNSNGYSTATGMPFPYDAVQQVSVELAPFDVTYGGFSACIVNAVTKRGTNEFEGNIFYEYTDDDFRGDQIEDTELKSPGYDENKWGATFGGPIIKDRLFFFVAYEETEEPQFNGMGPAGSGAGNERPWLTQADFDQIQTIAQNVYGYDTGGAPSDGVQENETYMARLDWQINDHHNASVVYNYFEGFQDRASDGDDFEFEFANHFYVKGSESETLTFKLNSQWTDAFSTELFWSNNTMDDLQQTRGPGDFGDFQISVNGRSNVVYLGADDSRQANQLNTESTYFRAVGTYLWQDHAVTFGYEQDELEIFNVFVQHSRGGEYDFFDDSTGNSAACAALTSQGRFDDASCGTSGIDKFALGRPSRIYYGSAGGSNNPLDAAAAFTNTQHSVYAQDEWIVDGGDLTLVFGLRYDWFSTDDSPVFNQAVSDTVGVRNDESIDGLSLLQPRAGFTWDVRDDISLRGGVGLYSGGNPNVWLSNTFSNDGITNVQLQLGNFSGSGSVLDGTIPLTAGGPGRGAPQALFDQVAATTAANASDERVVLLDPDFEQPGEFKAALGATWYTPWYDIVLDLDWLHSQQRDAALYVDLANEIVGTTVLGQPIYDFVNGEENYMLTNVADGDNGTANTLSVVMRKEFDFGLDLMLGYAYTESEDVAPMTSSVAFSNYVATATLDPNNPGLGDSEYVVPHRFTMRARWSKDLFRDLTTRVSLYGFAQEGQSQSYTMSGDDLEGGRRSRHLLYVPTGANDPAVVFSPGFDQAGFFAFADGEDLDRGQFVDRNETNAQWSYRLDMRIDQEIPTFVDGVKGRAFMNIFNLTNLLNDEWGEVNDAEFSPREVVDGGIDSQGRYVFDSFSNQDINIVREERSLWEIRFGLEIFF